MISPAERERRRLRAKQLVAEGKIGGARYGAMGGRPRRTPPSEMAARLAEVAPERLLAIVLDIANTSKTPSVRLRAARLLHEIDADARQRREEEARCPACGGAGGERAARGAA